MRTTLRIILPLIVSVAAVSLHFAAYQVRTEKRNLRNDLSSAFRSRPAAASRAAQEDTGVVEFLSAEQTDPASGETVPIHVYALPLHNNGEMAGTLALFHDTSYIDKQVSRTLRDSLLTAFIQTLLITGLGKSIWC